MHFIVHNACWNYRFKQNDKEIMQKKNVCFVNCNHQKLLNQMIFMQWLQVYINLHVWILVINSDRFNEACYFVFTDLQYMYMYMYALNLIVNVSKWRNYRNFELQNVTDSSESEFKNFSVYVMRHLGKVGL